MNTEKNEQLFDIIKHGFFPISGFEQRYPQHWPLQRLTYDYEPAEEGDDIVGYEREFHIHIPLKTYFNNDEEEEGLRIMMNLSGLDPANQEIAVVGIGIYQGDLISIDPENETSVVFYYGDLDPAENNCLIEHRFVITEWTQIDDILSNEWPKFVKKYVHEILQHQLYSIINGAKNNNLNHNHTALELDLLKLCYEHGKNVLEESIVNSLIDDDLGQSFYPYTIYGELFDLVTDLNDEYNAHNGLKES